jgi:hypothetical protein
MSTYAVDTALSGALPLPLAVQVGLAGSRRFVDPKGHAMTGPAFEATLFDELKAILSTLPRDLGLTSQHFLVGISQLAIGGDVLFTQACAELGWPQRLFLPQHRGDFLAATGSGGPDFSPEQRRRVETLFESTHIIEETVVSSAPGRAERFEDTNLAIVAEADVFVCLRREGAAGGRGGTADLIARAIARAKPVLELVLKVDASGRPALRPVWHQRDSFRLPALPEALRQLSPALPVVPGQAPDTATYVERLKSYASRRAARRSGWFKLAAWIIVGTHVGATILALTALKFSGTVYDDAVPTLLTIEFLLLAAGLYTHHEMHRERATPDWATARICAEVARSVDALRGIPVQLRHLLALPFPTEMRPLLRTLGLLQLGGIRSPANRDWKTLRANYVERRLRDSTSGQLDYYRHQSRRAKRQSLFASVFFSICSFAAILATASKLAAKMPVDWARFLGPLLPATAVAVDWAGVAAVVLPVMAVAAMSMAAALDLEARVHTFDDVREFLERQARHLEGASSEREFAVLAIDTETRLLGETLSWFARRSFTSVA